MANRTLPDDYKEKPFIEGYLHTRLEEERMAMGEQILQALHDSEINWQIMCQYDGGWVARLGCNDFSPLGYTSANCKAETTACGSLIEVVEWLRHTAIKHYPGSKFAKRFSAVAASATPAPGE